MLVSFHRIPELCSKTVQFWSVKLGNEHLTEFEKFDDLASEYSNPQHITEIRIIYNILEEMKVRGARRFYFKHEGSASALPIVSQGMRNSNTEDFGMRLYCIHVSESLVVLLNGGVKTKLQPEECANVKEHFKRAKKIATKLLWAIHEGYIEISDEGIAKDEGFEFDI